MSDELATTTDPQERAVENGTGAENEVKSQSAEEIALLIGKQQQQAQVNSSENVIVSNFLGFFEPLVKNLDANVEALRNSQFELTNQIKSLLNRKNLIVFFEFLLLIPIFYLICVHALVR